MALSAADLAKVEADEKFFEENGYVVIRDVLTPAEVAELELAADGVLTSDDVFVERTDGYSKIRDCFGVDTRFNRLLANEKVLARLVRLLSPNIHLVSSQLIFFESRPADYPRQIRIPERTGWHQDIHGVVADLHGQHNVPRLAIKCAHYFTDVRPSDSGMTMFLPGSHQLSEPVQIAPGTIDPPGAVAPHVEPGDVVLFENRLWHASGINTSGMTRKCMMMQYAYRWFRPVDDATLGPINGVDYSQAAAQNSFSQIERQLLDALELDLTRERPRGAGSRPLLDWSLRCGLL